MGVEFDLIESAATNLFQIKITLWILLFVISIRECVNCCNTGVENQQISIMRRELGQGIQMIRTNTAAQVRPAAAPSHEDPQATNSV